jgi:hypothetical protein
MLLYRQYKRNKLKEHWKEGLKVTLPLVAVASSTGHEYKRERSSLHCQTLRSQSAQVRELMVLRDVASHEAVTF